MDRDEIIKDLRAKGLTYRQIRKRTGYSQASIWRALEPESYRHYNEKRRMRIKQKYNSQRPARKYSLQELKRRATGILTDEELLMP